MKIKLRSRKDRSRVEKFTFRRNSIGSPPGSRATCSILCSHWRYSMSESGIFMRLLKDISTLAVAESTDVIFAEFISSSIGMKLNFEF